tara:strand:+ start:131 stop:328 length:198 start_codon:yes stop_codon:yes gene_type:complete
MAEKVERRGRPKMTDQSKKKTDALIVRMSPDFKKKFRKYCDENGFAASLRVCALIKKDMKDNGYV